MKDFSNPNISVNCKKSAPATQKIPRMLTIKQVAMEFGLAEHFVRELAKSGKIICVRAGNKFLINADKLIEFLNTNTLGAEEEELCPQISDETPRSHSLG